MQKELEQSGVVIETNAGTELQSLIQEILVKGAGSGSSILVSGEEGVGKTFIVENALHNLTTANPILIARHYQHYQNIPYFGFKNSISTHLGNVFNQLGRRDLQAFASELKDYLGESYFLLLDYLPELSLLFGEESGVITGAHLTIENQLYPLFKRLFEFLVQFHKTSLVFFTDDLQWMDASGINLLKYLLLNLSPRKVIWIGASRTPISKITLVGQLIEELGTKGVSVKTILHRGFDKAKTQTYVNALIGGNGSEQLVNLSFKICGGNPTQLQAFITDLKDGGLLFDNGVEVDGDAALITLKYERRNQQQRRSTDEIKTLSKDVRDLLAIVACMGKFDAEVLLACMDRDRGKLEEALDYALEAGIVERYEKDVRFAKQGIEEEIYRELSESALTDLHYRIGNAIYSRDKESINTSDLILMTRSFNHSLSRVREDQKVIIVAELNYRSGKALQNDKSFEEARHFYKMSAELLKECPWEEVGEQVWRVYMDRARIEYHLGEYDLAEIHLDYLLQRIDDPLKRAKVFELKITINNHLARYQKVIWILREGLGELGLELPLEESLVREEVARLRLKLQEREEASFDRPDGALNNPDQSEAILRLLYVGGMSLHHTSDVLMTWAALQIILGASKDKPSAVQAIGYVSYGRMLIIAGDIERGYQFGSKGLSINKALDDITLRCRVFGVYAFYIQPWMKAFAESNPLLEQGAEAGRKAGDLIGVYILKTHQLNLHLIAGLPLKGLSQWDFEESYPGMELTYYITHYQKNLIRFLTGESSVFSIPRQNPSSLAGRLTIQEEKFYRNYVWAKYYFLFGHYELAVRSAEESHANRKLQEGSPLLPANLLMWFLSVTQNWNNYSGSAQRAHSARAVEVLHQFESWKNFAASNYEPAWLLMNAEWNRINGNDDTAFNYFQRSLHAAGSNIFHKAITCELWAKFLIGKDVKDERGRGLMHLAIDSFLEWDAVAKSKQLKTQYEALLQESEASSAIVDIETIQYELSGDMEVSSLVKKLMVLLLRISGSSHVAVELVEDIGDRIWYDELSLFNDKAKEAPIVPKSFILGALKARNAVVVNDLSTEKNVRDFDYLHSRGVRSFMMLPVTISGHLSMVVYLENVFQRDWYSPERLKSIKITANQGAVMIENARIHEHAIKLNDDLRKEMQEKERLSSLIEAQKDAHLKALMQAQDNERKRIASDLHDSLGSLLSSVRLRFNGLQHEFFQKIPDKAQRFDDSLKLLDEAIDELRQISHNMAPVSLSRFGLRSALQTFLAQVRASGALEIHTQILGLDERLPEEMEVRVYRICQELVQNVIKHAQASVLRIQLILHNDSLNVLVEDNGVGLDKESLSRGFGFSTIKSNVDLFRGSFEIESQPGKGCLVLIDLPVSTTSHK